MREDGGGVEAIYHEWGNFEINCFVIDTGFFVDIGHDDNWLDGWCGLNEEIFCVKVIRLSEDGGEGEADYNEWVRKCLH
mgnify:CR=1 FL=1